MSGRCAPSNVAPRPRPGGEVAPASGADRPAALPHAARVRLATRECSGHRACAEAKFYFTLYPAASAPCQPIWIINTGQSDRRR